MSYSPADVVRADQTLADLNDGLDKLVASCPGDMSIHDIDDLASILDDTVSHDVLIVALSVAIHRLAARR